MERIAILDHENHRLIIEDISDKDLEKYNGEEEAYIRDNYDLNPDDYSWDYITDIEYLQEDDKDPVDVSDLKGAFI